MKQINLSPKVLIVGGGLAGITLGVLLKRNKINVLVVERSKTALATFKGEYLQPFAVNFLNNNDMGGIFADTNAGTIKELRFRELRSTTQGLMADPDLLIRYPSGEAARSLSYVKLQEQLRKLAQEELGDDFLEGGVLHPINTNANGTIISEDLKHPKLKLSHEGHNYILTPEWVAGCDGKGSQVRRWIHGTGTKASRSATLGSGLEYIVGAEVDCNATSPHRYEVIRTQREGTFSFFGLGNQKQRLYWNANKSNQDGKYWKETIHKNLAQISDVTGIQHENVGTPMGAEANSAWLGHAHKGRFILVGDALSVTTPFGGQGMNAVVKHVEYLTQLFSENTHHNSIEKGLSSYQNMAFKYYTHLGLINFCLYHLFFNRHPIGKSVTAHALNRWEQRPYLKDRVGRLFGGLDQDTPKPLEIYELLGGFPGMHSFPSLSSFKNPFTHQDS